MRTSKWFKSVALMMTLLFMAACGGGGGGGGPEVEPPSGATTGIAVDPYIIGAVFQEKTSDGDVVQVSTPSDENGRFTFAEALTDGNLIEIDPNNRGLHNGVPFTGTLKRKIDDTGELVTSPLTTLLAEGKSETEVVGILKTAGVEVSEADLKANPMEKLEGKDSTELTDEDLAVLVATIAVNAALAILDQDVDSDELATLVQSIAAVVKTKVLASDKIGTLIKSAPGATVENIVSTAVAVTDAVVETVKKDGGEVEAAAENIDDTVVTESVSSAASGGGSVSLEKDETGSFKPVNHTLRYFLDKGFAALTSASSEGKSADLFAAVEAFQAAGKLVDTDTQASANDKDTALFFSALTGVISLAKPYSDTVDNGLNNVGDILDALGVDADRTVFDTIELPKKNCVQATNYDGTPMTDEQGAAVMECEDDLSKVDLTTGQLQDFMFDKIGGELGEAIKNLDKISESFNSTEWADPMDNSANEFDYADVLFLKGLAKAMLGQLSFQQAYDFSIDIADTDAKANAEAGYTAEDFFADNPTLGKLKDAAKMTAAKDYFSSAIDAFKAAIEAMEAESDQGVEQEDDLVTFYNVEYNYYTPRPLSKALCRLKAKTLRPPMTISTSTFTRSSAGSTCAISCRLSAVMCPACSPIRPSVALCRRKSTSMRIWMATRPLMCLLVTLSSASCSLKPRP